MSDFEELKRLLEKEDLNPAKAAKETKDMLLVFMFFTGVLPFLIVAMVKLVPLFLVIGGLILLSKGIRMAWNRSRHL